MSVQPALQHVAIDGLRFAKITQEGLIALVLRAAGDGRGGWIVTANTDYLHRYVTDPSMPELLEAADVVVADGVPLLWSAAISGSPLPERVAGSDLVHRLAGAAAGSGLSLYLLGGAPGAAEGAARRLRADFPSLRIAGHASPRVTDPPTPQEIATIERQLAACSPGIVYVALGSPKQDRLIVALRERMPGVWWIGVGVSLSFLAGGIPRAPRWMQRVGLEWLHRMLQEPGRLWRRYLVADLPFAARLLWRSTLARFRK